MSSILKALQKLETTSAQQAIGRQLTGKSTTRTILKWRMVSISIALFFIIITGSFFLINRSGTDLKPISDITKDKQEAGVYGPDTRSSQGGNKIPTSPVREQTYTTQNDLKPEKPGRMDPLNQAVQITRTSSSAPSDNNTGHIMPAHIAPPITQNKEKDNAVPRTLPPRQVDKISTIPDMSIIDPSILKLQAISWSSTPKDRMVVINNRILREKSVIEGYTIILIGQDSVIAEKDAKKEKLVFK